MNDTTEAAFDSLFDGQVTHAWLFRVTKLDNHVNRYSSLFAYLGFSVALMAATIWIWMGLDWIPGKRAPFGLLDLMIRQAVIYPFVVALVFAIVVPMYSQASLLVRLVLAAVVIFPAAALYLLTGLLDIRTSLLLLGGVATGVAFLTTGNQLSRDWVLVSYPGNMRPQQRIGIRTMIEITAIVALVFAGLAVWRSTTLLAAVLVGLIVGYSIMGLVVVVLGSDPKPIRRAAKSALGMFVFACADCYLTLGYRIKATSDILIPAAPGTIALMLCILIGAIWLRGCGWRCVRLE